MIRAIYYFLVLLPFQAFSQTIEWHEPSTRVLIPNRPYTLEADALGVPVSFRILRGNGDLFANTLTARAAGEIEVIAEALSAPNIPSLTRVFNLSTVLGVDSSTSWPGDSRAEPAATYGIRFNGTHGFALSSFSRLGRGIRVYAVPARDGIPGIPLVNSYVILEDASGLDGVSGIEVVGSYLYLGSSYYDSVLFRVRSEIRVFRIENDSLYPVRQVELSSGARVHSIRAFGTRLVLGHGYDGVTLLDITDPSFPQERGRYYQDDQQRPINDLCVTGDLMVLGRGYPQPAELECVDISNLASPQRLSVFAIGAPGDAAFGVDGSGRYIYVADYYGGLQVIDLRNPAAPRVAGSAMVGVTPFRGVRVYGSYAYTLGGSTFRVFDISNPTAPTLVGSVRLPVDGIDLHLAGNLAWIRGEHTPQLAVVDVSDPASPALVASTFDDRGNAIGVAATGTTALLADDLGGLRIFDISQVAEAGSGAPPRQLSRFATRGRATRVTPSPDGSTAYISEGASGFEIVNISNPRSPVLISSIATEAPVSEVVPYRSMLFVVQEERGVDIYDATLLTAVIRIGNMPSRDAAMSVQALGDRAYIADGAAGLSVFEISDPRSPTYLAGIDTPGFASSLAIRNGIGFVADGARGLQIVDISPSPPQLIGSFDTSGFASRVQIHGTTAMVADGSPGVVFLDVIDPRNPVLLFTAAPGTSALDLAISGNKVLVADASRGLQVNNLRHRIRQQVYLSLPPVISRRGLPVTPVTGADSELPVSIEVISGPLRLRTDGTLEPTGLGTASVRAFQGGDDYFAPASTVAMTEVRPVIAVLNSQTIANDYLAQGFQLQSAPSVVGPWLTIPNVSRLTLDQANGRVQFFRLFKASQ